MMTKITFNWRQVLESKTRMSEATRILVESMASGVARDIGDTIIGKAPGPNGWKDLIEESIGDHLSVADAMGMRQHFIERVEWYVANCYAEKVEWVDGERQLIKPRYKIIWPCGRVHER